MQNKHYFTSLAIKFYTSIVDKNALIKPSAKGKGKDVEFSEFCEKKWSILTYFWRGYTPWQANEKEK